MLVRNRYTNDSRVEKEARTLVAAGLPGQHRRRCGPGPPDGRDPRRQRDPSGSRGAGRRSPACGSSSTSGGSRDGCGRSVRPCSTRTTRMPWCRSRSPRGASASRSSTTPMTSGSAAHAGSADGSTSALSQLYYGLVERRLVPRAAATLTVSPPIVGHLRRRYRLAGRPPRPELSRGRRAARAPRAARPARRRERSTPRGRSSSTSAG